MNQQHINSLVPNPTGQLPQLELVYGCCAGILGVSPEWTGLKMRDDTGEIAVYILSSLISVSDSLVDECMLLVNDSGKSGLGRLPDGTPCTPQIGSESKRLENCVACVFSFLPPSVLTRDLETGLLLQASQHLYASFHPFRGGIVHSILRLPTACSSIC